MSSDSSSES
ncbi:5048efc3-a9c3-4dc9-bdee-fc802dcf0398 [Thermothielavioides terrestris]|uniref:5048efc3-a9c3-4dc9-bdee-fc802dcf0398 n=1 Tax=Thermothielavioides terrestris TaxID=2587410 RepID=A0A3S4B968_9PEZI|nr:5048efc3-a9c3-4dc9-bdee-fc802dcf0398 [Thermothielavioides terrestris]